MKNIGILLSGLSLLTLAMVIILSRVAEAVFSIARNPTYTTPFFVYILIGIVFLLGVALIFGKEQK
ncbi:hypothetical protein [Lentibacillus salicampi]|uniref:DUF3955 domain-containing protein n=1 Tax=Lentibacillus salicampi TaxID=175306 RepID=A0A4Y9ABE6_9BACI|nr:hypothetical protein [Lentibacillus salicampi]TFJ91684.1 hypothetical protein E4U82_16255 [Lentibacillus salicampi]